MLHIESIFLSYQNLYRACISCSLLYSSHEGISAHLLQSTARKSPEDRKLSKILFLTPRCLAVKGGIVSRGTPTEGEGQKLTW